MNVNLIKAEHTQPKKNSVCIIDSSVVSRGHRMGNILHQQEMARTSTCGIRLPVNCCDGSPGPEATAWELGEGDSDQLASRRKANCCCFSLFRRRLGLRRRQWEESGRAFLDVRHGLRCIALVAERAGFGCRVGLRWTGLRDPRLHRLEWGACSSRSVELPCWSTVFSQTKDLQGHQVLGIHSCDCRLVSASRLL